jgi:hypothetical protein
MNASHRVVSLLALAVRRDCEELNALQASHAVSFGGNAEILQICPTSVLQTVLSGCEGVRPTLPKPHNYVETQGVRDWKKRETAMERVKGIEAWPQRPPGFL